MNTRELVKKWQDEHSLDVHVPNSESSRHWLKD
jgi:hypothetical protein